MLQRFSWISFLFKLPSITLKIKQFECFSCVILATNWFLMSDCENYRSFYQKSIFNILKLRVLPTLIFCVIHQENDNLEGRKAHFHHGSITPWARCSHIRWCGSNGTQTQDHLVFKRTLNHLAKLTSLVKRWSINLRTKWLWARIPLLSHKLQISCLFWKRSYMRFR